MAIEHSQIAQITARAGLARAGTARAGCAPEIYELKDDATGEVIFNRADQGTQDGNPVENSATWTTGRE